MSILDDDLLLDVQLTLDRINTNFRILSLSKLIEYNECKVKWFTNNYAVFSSASLYHTDTVNLESILVDHLLKLYFGYKIVDVYTPQYSLESWYKQNLENYLKSHIFHNGDRSLYDKRFLDIKWGGTVNINETEFFSRHKSVEHVVNSVLDNFWGMVYTLDGLGFDRRYVRYNVKSYRKFLRFNLSLMDIIDFLYTPIGCDYSVVKCVDSYKYSELMVMFFYVFSSLYMKRQTKSVYLLNTCTKEIKSFVTYDAVGDLLNESSKMLHFLGDIKYELTKVRDTLIPLNFLQLTRNDNSYKFGNSICSTCNIVEYCMYGKKYKQFFDKSSYGSLRVL